MFLIEANKPSRSCLPLFLDLCWGPVATPPPPARTRDRSNAELSPETLRQIRAGHLSDTPPYYAHFTMTAVQLSAPSAPSETDDADKEPPQRPLFHTSDGDQDQTGIFSFSTSPSTALSPASAEPSSTSPAQPLRQFPTADVEVHDTILEASDEESDCDSPIEPVTPVSGRLSAEGFAPAAAESVSAATTSTAATTSVSVPTEAKALPITIPPTSAHHTPHKHHHAHHSHNRRPSHQDSSFNSGANANADPINGASAASLEPSDEQSGRPTTAVNGSFLIEQASAVRSSAANPETASTQSYRPSRTSSSASGFKRTMSNLFRRSNSQNDKIAFAAPDFSAAAAAASELNLAEMNANTAVPARKTPNRRWSMHRALASPPSHSSPSPPSPSSPGSPPLEMALGGHKHGGAAPTAAGRNGAAPNGPAKAASGDSSGGRPSTSAPTERAGLPLPTQDDFLQNERKKFRQRATTGLTFHNAMHIVTGSSTSNGSRLRNRDRRTDYMRRSSSVDHGNSKNAPHIQLGGEPWGLPAEAGTGLKARRMSLSLPDDFTVDVIDLHSEFEYAHILGRHRRHLGKGTTSKVTLMHRKGFPEEVVAVKEFRGKSSSETPEEYEKKVKSEYSISKSLHHPNIVETLCLCTDHGRWNHVMEFCQEGDLFSLVQKKYLTGEDREKDRLCLFKQLIQGLSYLHSHGIAHRDIKLDNLLLTNNSKLKITDFGASDVFCGIHPGLREAGGRCGANMDGTVRLCKPGVCGSLPYISPEVLEAKEPYDPRKLDVWAAAVVMLNLIFGAPLWEEARVRPGQSNQYTTLVKSWERHRRRYPHCTNLDAEVERKVDNPPETQADGAATSAASGDRPVVPATPPDDQAAPALDGPYPKVEAFDYFVNPPVLRRILLHMLNPDAAERVTIDQVANLRWIKHIECCQPEAYEDPFAPAKPQTIDASKGGYVGRPGQKIFCHDHLPRKLHSHAIGRIG